ncbi:hypothetical protein EPR50_G00231270 [Perca flavescens]|uniref:Uncharacterized protein n=1 Tax=Perca flavescens TaxID=8167 RepID=A0A484BZC6_PERFV|nr:hypothetical protein EPR50_G00231270 [Perca flavescens]
MEWSVLSSDFSKRAVKSGALDGARPVGSAPEPCVAPPRGTNRTHLHSRLATVCEIQVAPARTHGSAVREEQETREVGLHVTGIR